MKKNEPRAIADIGSKKPYHEPELQIFGAVKDLTAGGSRSTPEDNPNIMNDPGHPQWPDYMV